MKVEMRVFMLILIVLFSAQKADSKLPKDVYEFWDTKNIEKVVFFVKISIFTESDLESIRKNDPVRYNMIDGFARSVFFGWRLQAEEPRYQKANDKAVNEYVEHFLKQDKETIDIFINSYINPKNREKITNYMTYTIYENLFPRYSRLEQEKIENFYDMAKHSFVLYQKVAEQIIKKIK